MAIIKGKLKADEKVSGTLMEVDADENKVHVKVGDKETVITVNSMTAEYIENNFSKDDAITIGFDGVDFDVE